MPWKKTDLSFHPSESGEEKSVYYRCSYAILLPVKLNVSLLKILLKDSCEQSLSKADSQVSWRLWKSRCQAVTYRHKRTDSRKLRNQPYVLTANGFQVKFRVWSLICTFGLFLFWNEGKAGFTFQFLCNRTNLEKCLHFFSKAFALTMAIIKVL